MLSKASCRTASFASSVASAEVLAARPHGRLRTARISSLVLLLGAVLFTSGCWRDTPDRLIERGRGLLAAGDVPAAIVSFRKAIAMAPHDEEAHYQLAIANLAVGNGRVAADSLERAVQLNPQDWRAQTKLAELMATSWDERVLSGAQEKLTEAVGKLGGDPAALMALAVVEWKLGAHEDAQRRLEQLLSAAPGRLDPVIALAQMKLASGGRNAAEALLRGALRGSGPAAQIALAEFHIVTGRLAEAGEELHQALARDRENAAALLDLAALEASRNRKEEAARAYQKLASLRDARYRPLYGWFLLQSGDTAGAVAEFERLLKEDPQSDAMRTNLLSAYLAAGREADAARMLRAAVSRQDPGFDALLQKAVFDLGKGRAEDAQASVMAALRLRPEAAEAHYVLAAVRLRRGEVLSSVEELDRAIARNPLFLPARTELARYRIVSKAPDVALEVLGRASAGQRSAPSVLASRAWALLATGDGARLRAVLDATGNRTPEAAAALRVPEALFRLEQGDTAGARTIAEEMLRADSSDVRAWLLLARAGATGSGVSGALESARRSAAGGGVDAGLFRGGLAMAARHYREAEDVLKETADGSGGLNAELETALARAEILNGKVSAAEPRLRRLAAAAPGDMDARFLLGAAQQMAGAWAAAAESYEKVLAANSEYVPALHNLAFLLAEHRGRADEALHFAESARELAPESASVEDVFGWVLYRRGLSSLALIHLRAAAAQGNVRAAAHIAAVRALPENPSGVPPASSDPVSLGWVDLGAADNSQARAETYQRRSGCRLGATAFDALLWERDRRRFTERIIPALMLCEPQPPFSTAPIPALQAATVENIRNRWTNPDSIVQRVFGVAGIKGTGSAGWDNTFISWDETREGPQPKTVPAQASDLAFRPAPQPRDNNGWEVYDSLWPRPFH